MINSLINYLINQVVVVVIQVAGQEELFILLLLRLLLRFCSTRLLIEVGEARIRLSSPNECNYNDRSSGEESRLRKNVQSESEKRGRMDFDQILALRLS